jgi:uncharacterized protein (TIGR02284 family)
MKDVKKYTIEVLQELINTNKDEYLLFESASRKSGDAELKSLFSAYAGKKKEYISRLEKEVIRLGGCSEANKNDSENPGEFYESSLFEKNWEILIADCLKKDDLVINKYFYAIRKNIMWEVVPLIANQYFGSKSFHDQIKNICMERLGGMVHKLETY